MLHPITAGCIFFSSSHGTFNMRNHTLTHKTHLNKFRSIEIKECVLSDHNALELEINNNKITHFPNTWKMRDHKEHRTGTKHSPRKLYFLFSFVCW